MTPKMLAQQEVAATLTKNISMQYSMANQCFEDAGESTTLACSVAMVGLAAACMNMTTSCPERPPTDDELLFVCLFAAQSASFSRDDTLTIEFDINNVIKALAMFKEITGRSIETLRPSLLDKIEKLKNKATFPQGMSQFKPN